MSISGVARDGPTGGFNTTPGGLEGGKGPERQQERQLTDTILLVTCEGDGDAGHPHNWSNMRKWAISVLLSQGGLVTLMFGAMLAPALSSIASDLGTSQDEAQIFLSIFVLSFAFGPMVLAPLAETFGCRQVWIVPNCFYILWNTVCGFIVTSGLLIAGRLLDGIRASVDFALTNLVLADLWPPSQRGKSFAIATFFPLLGPALGPIVGGAVTQTIGWRWIVWILSIFDGVLVLVVLAVFRETYAIILLRRRAATLRKQTNQPYHVANNDDGGSDPLTSKLSRALTRPVRLLATQAALLWVERYRQIEAQSGLQCLALVIGYTLAAQVGARAKDRLWRHLKEKKKADGDGDAVPEYYRVPLMVPGAMLIPAGLFFLRSIAGFAFPLFAPLMYRSLGYGWGNSFLAFVSLALGRAVDLAANAQLQRLVALTSKNLI
ncbi:major facilitator superfamily domain-containing protein [Thermothelomyces heterothallicus CBS 202.75]|uniref:major facilitator superfamily domain-containing protein n=1 Tax=Thermothelomyces heterothallicus CBS 202.75 TaxID=1149848 RepID=UPI003742578E